MTNCRHWRSSEWGCVHDLEDVMARLADIDNHRLIIKRHAWREGSWHQVFAEASAQGRDIEELRQAFSELWHKWIAETKGDD